VSAASPTTPSLAEFEKRDKVLRALQDKKGRATLGDLIVATGLPKGESESALRGLLKDYESHLAVDDKGDILYLFEPSFLKRGERDLWARRMRALSQTLWKAFVLFFKVAIMLTLVVYFLLFVALIIAAFVAMNSNNNNNSSSSSRSSGGGFHWIFWFWGDSGSRHDYRAGRTSARQEEAQSKPFYQKVFDFVFGPNETPADPLQEERALLSWIRTQKGRITAADLATRTGATLQEAEDHATRLLVDYGGDVEVTDNGTLLYTFKELLVRGGRGGEVAPAPAIWARFLPPQSLTGNTGGTNALIIFLNAFIVFGALIAPGFIFEALDFESSAAWVGLYYIPLAFGALFFGVPVARIFGNYQENKRRVIANLRRASLKALFESAQKQPLWIDPTATQSQIETYYVSGLKSLKLDPAGADLRAYSGVSAVDQVRAHEAGVEWLLRAYAGEPTNAESGRVVYSFDRVSREVTEAQAARKAARAEEESMGKLVFRSDGDLQ
jgi:hypothetical protein